MVTVGNKNIWYFLSNIVLACCEKKCSCDRDKLWKFEAEGCEFAKKFQSLDQFSQTMKGQYNF